MAMKPDPFRSPMMEGPPGRYPPPVPLEYRIHLLNKRLQDATAEFDNIWWDEMISEFFEDNAALSISMVMEEGPKQYHIGRTLIPRFFRSFYTGGVSELYFITRHAKEILNHATHSRTMECAQASMVSHHMKPIPTKICTEGHLLIEFSCDQFSRIRLWNFDVRLHSELIARHCLMQEPHILEKLSVNMTKRGVNQQTISYLRLCEILEPMKEIMMQQKTCNIDPRDCLRNCLYQKWQRMMNPPEPVRGKRVGRKRKPSNTNPASQVSSTKKKNFPTSDVMVVGEPSLMGGEFGDEDERMITRLENQYDSVGGVKMENPDAPSQGFSRTASPAVRPNTMSPWQQSQTVQPQPRPPSQAGVSASGPGSQTPSVPESNGGDVMPSTPISAQN